MPNEQMESLVSKMLLCTSCSLRNGCTQVVPPVGNFDKPILLIIAESPGQTEDECGEQMMGPAGDILRETLRNSKVLNRKNTVITSVIKCRPPKNKFPTNDCPSICFSSWLSNEIELLKPERMLLLGSRALEYVANLDGITKCRGTWIIARGIRTMSTFHPNYILKADSDGMHHYRETFERDVMDVAREVAYIEKERFKNASSDKDKSTVVNVGG